MDERDMAQGLVAFLAALVLIIAGFVGANLMLPPDDAVGSSCTVREVHLDALPTATTAGEPLQLAGRVTTDPAACDRNVEVAVYAKQSGDHYRQITRVTTAADGTWLASHRPARLTAYLARVQVIGSAASVDSTTVKHAVATRITISSPVHNAAIRGRAQILGRLLPPHRDAPVTIGYRRAGTTTRIGATATAPDGTFRVSAPVPAGSGVLVVSVPPHGGNAAGHASVSINARTLPRPPAVAPSPMPRA